MIFNHPKIHYSEDETSYESAIVFGSIRLICFLPVPKSEFKEAERNIELVIEHETIGIVMDELGKNNHNAFDRLFPMVSDMRKFKEGQDEINIHHGL